MNIREYLEGPCHSFPNDAIISHFSEKFGVKVRIHQNLIQFKYDMLDAKWSLPLTHQCRGVILRKEKSGRYSFVTRPFDKFFGLHEGFCPLFDKKTLELEIPLLLAREKVDGTCIQLWFDTEVNLWRVSTLGTIIPEKVGESDLTFTQLFWSLLPIHTLGYLDEEYTYILEIASKENAVVTTYKKPRVSLLGARKTQTGEYLQLEQLADIANEVGGILDTPYQAFLSDIGVTDHESLIAWVASEYKNTKYGICPEGCVLYRGPIPLAKVKCLSYLTAHSILTNGDINMRRRIFSSLINGSIDDLQAVFTDKAREVLGDCEKRLQGLVETSQSTWDYIVQQNPQSRKDFALLVNKQAPSASRPLFFQLFSERIEPTDMRNLIINWLKEDENRQERLW
jgi:hypothetical protein